MIKVLVVNNYTKYSDDLLHILKGCDVTITSPERLDEMNLDHFQRIILTGGSIFAIRRNETMYEQELKLIRECRVPLLGICLGCELIALAFDGSIQRRDTRIRGFDNLDVDTDDSLFQDINGVTIYHNHIWEITKVPSLFEILLEDKHGPIAIKHNQLPIYGVQFHPEVSAPQVIKNFINLTNSLPNY